MELASWLPRMISTCMPKSQLASSCTQMFYIMLRSHKHNWLRAYCGKRTKPECIQGKVTSFRQSEAQDGAVLPICNRLQWLSEILYETELSEAL
jgi:hypothetical protein